MTIHHARRFVILIGLVILFSNNGSAEETLTDAQRTALLKSAIRIRYERREGRDICVGHGTAFGIDLNSYGRPGKRYLLSAAHNILDRSGKPYPTLKVEMEKGTERYWLPCKPISADKNLDICLLEVAEELPAVVSLAPVDEKVMAPVIMAGSPRGIPVQLYEGKLVRRFHEGSVQSLAEIEFDHGCSGGPVFSQSTGKVIGLAVAGIPKGDDLDHSKGLFVPASAIESFIAPLGMGEHAAAEPVKSKLSPVLANKVESKRSLDVPRSRPRLPAGEMISETELLSLDPRNVTVNGTYVVQRDDTLAGIARRFQVSIQSLMALNSISDADRITLGRKLRIY